MRKNYELVWMDDFNGAAGSPPGPEYWNHEVGGHGWGNGECQTYTTDPRNAYQDGSGNLCIVARKDPQGFSSARINTKGLVEFQYGRMETRIKLPKGAGLWAAAWLLGNDIDLNPWPACGEIDAMEYVAAHERRIFGTVHCPDHFQRGGISGDHISRTDLSDGFHRFAVDWHADEISWSVDDTEYFKVTKEMLGPSWVFDHPFYLLVNLAVGGWLGGEVSDNTEFPAAMQVDYVKIFSLK